MEQLAGMDLSGLETLQRFKQATRFNRWLFQKIAHYCSGKILEVGSGIGNISELLLDHYSNVALSDLRPEYCNFLQERFNKYAALQGIYQLDLIAQDFEEKYQLVLGKFDTIIALNVIEHVQDDVLAVGNCRKMLKPGGYLIILVPAHKKLYNKLDVELGHFKRYDKDEIAGLLNRIPNSEAYLQYFNFAGIAGWWFTGSILKKKIIPQLQLNFYDMFVPFFKWVDRVISNKTGLSLIGVVKVI